MDPAVSLAPATHSVDLQHFEYLDDEHILGDLLCQICAFPCVEAVEHPVCGKIFCAACLGRVEACPNCRGALVNSLRPPSRIVLNMLNALRVRCPLDPAHVVERGNLAGHLDSSCPRPCPRGCGERLPRSAFAQHIAVCVLEPIPCPGAALGCPQVPSRCELDAHTRKCTVMAMAASDIFRHVEGRFAAAEREWAAERAELQRVAKAQAGSLDRLEQCLAALEELSERNREISSIVDQLHLVCDRCLNTRKPGLPATCPDHTGVRVCLECKKERFMPTDANMNADGSKKFPGIQYCEVSHHKQYLWSCCQISLGPLTPPTSCQWLHHEQAKKEREQQLKEAGFGPQNYQRIKRDEQKAPCPEAIHAWKTDPQKLAQQQRIPVNRRRENLVVPLHYPAARSDAYYFDPQPEL
jgi:hypothetical protein